MDNYCFIDILYTGISQSWVVLDATGTENSIISHGQEFIIAEWGRNEVTKTGPIVIIKTITGVSIGSTR